VGGLLDSRYTAAEGAALFAADFRPDRGLGPLFNATSCVTCHDEPVAGGMAKGIAGTVLRVGRLGPDGFDPLEGHGGPVARARSVVEFGETCPLAPGIPPGANATSVRNAPPLFGLGLIETIPDAAILAEAQRQDDAGSVRGRPNRVTDAHGQPRVGRFGWKAQTGRLEEFVGDAFRTELGITNPVAPLDLVVPPPGTSCAGHQPDTEDDGKLVRAVTAYISALPAPAGRAEDTHREGARIFRRIGCAECHTPALSGPSGEVPLYSDLLLHDLGRALDDGIVQGEAQGRDWRTTPLWGLRLRGRFLHDARAESLGGAIAAHGGEAAAAASHFRGLTEAEREALLEFLRNL
jgi:CxxC motif-containing protein (DUF1111 family)